MDEVAEIKSRLDIVQVIGEHVKLQKSGQNWKGCCPFHNEKTPSFMVNQERQFYYCFGCSQGGDIFTFLQKVENLEFPEVLKILAKRAGIELKKYDERAVNQRTRLLDLLNLAASYWQKQLLTPAGAAAKEYLKKRQLDAQTAEDFRLGYALDSWDNLLKYLLKQKYTETEIFQAGLIVKKEQGSGYYDRFRDRVMFPIQDLYGNVIGFTARTMKASENAKYINTPETPVYHKGNVLYALDKAKNEIKKQDAVIFVEGNMDVISSHRVGVKNVVAVSGTALTPEQIHLIKRFTLNVYFCFDMDEAGQKAAKRSIDLALDSGLNIKIVQVLFGKDPDDCIKHDPADWQASIAQARSIMQFHFDEIFNKFNLSEIDEKKQAAKLLLSEIIKLPDSIEQDYWIKELAQKLSVSDAVLREALPGRQRANIKPTNQATKTVAATLKKVKLDTLAELIIGFLLDAPQNIKQVGDRLPPEMIPDKLRKLYTSLIILYNENINLDKQQVSEFIKDSTKTSLAEDYLNSLYILIDKEFPNLTSVEKQKEFLLTICEFKKQYYVERIKFIETQIPQAEKDNNTAKLNDLLGQLQELMRQKNSLS